MSFFFHSNTQIFAVPWGFHTHTHANTRSYHPDWPAGAHVIIEGIPALKLGVLAVLQDVLLAFKIWMVEADEGAALHADRVDPVHEAAVLEVVAVAADLQFPPGETFPLKEHNLDSSETENNTMWIWVIVLMTDYFTCCAALSHSHLSRTHLSWTLRHFPTVFSSKHSIGVEKFGHPDIYVATEWAVLSRGRGHKKHNKRGFKHFAMWTLSLTHATADIGVWLWRAKQYRRYFALIGLWEGCCMGLELWACSWAFARWEGNKWEGEM